MRRKTSKSTLSVFKILVSNLWWPSGGRKGFLSCFSSIFFFFFSQTFLFCHETHSHLWCMLKISISNKGKEGEHEQDEQDEQEWKKHHVILSAISSLMLMMALKSKASSSLYLFMLCLIHTHRPAFLSPGIPRKTRKETKKSLLFRFVLRFSSGTDSLSFHENLFVSFSLPFPLSHREK